MGLSENAMCFIFGWFFKQLHEGGDSERWPGWAQDETQVLPGAVCGPAAEVLHSTVDLAWSAAWAWSACWGASSRSGCPARLGDAHIRNDLAGFHKNVSYHPRITQGQWVRAMRTALDQIPTCDARKNVVKCVAIVSCRYIRDVPHFNHYSYGPIYKFYVSEKTQFVPIKNNRYFGLSLYSSSPCISISWGITHFWPNRHRGRCGTQSALPTRRRHGSAWLIGDSKGNSPSFAGL